jgi:hypothetical protein
MVGQNPNKWNSKKTTSEHGHKSQGHQGRSPFPSTTYDMCRFCISL